MTAPAEVPTNVVYVIGNDANRLVKIGTTAASTLDRLGQIQTMSPAILTVLWTTPGDRELEHKLHYRFRAERRHGEWFDFGTLDPIVEVAHAVEEIIRAKSVQETSGEAVVAGPASLTTGLVQDLTDASQNLSWFLLDNEACSSLTPDEVGWCLDQLAYATICLAMTAGFLEPVADGLIGVRSAATEAAGVFQRVDNQLMDATRGFQAAARLFGIEPGLGQSKKRSQ